MSDPEQKRGHPAGSLQDQPDGLALFCMREAEKLRESKRYFLLVEQLCHSA